MASHLQTLIAYLSAHPELALIAVFGASFLEALAIVGTFVPGSTIVFAGGTLIGLGAIALWPTVVVAVIGAILGDGISYWLGRHHSARLRSIWPLKSRPDLLERGQLFFARHGGKSVFLGRFLSPTRAVVPVIAGMSHMPIGSFYLMNVLSAFAWAALHLLPGMLFGASVSLAGAISARLGILLVAAVLSIWAVVWLVRQTYDHVLPHVRRWRDRLVQWAVPRTGLPSRVVMSLLDPARPESTGLLIAALVLLGSAWVFFGTLEDVVSRDTLTLLDQAVFTTLQGLRTDWLDHVMVTITELGSAAVAIPVIATVSVVLGLTRCWRTLAYWLAAVGFEQVLVWILKLTVGRARPTNIYTGLEQFSFPSGHAASSIVLYGFLGYLLARGKSNQQKLVIALLATLAVLLISFSRIYLGAHWMSDVLGSLTLGAAWIAVLSIAYTQHVQRERVPMHALWLGTLGALVVAGSLVVASQHARDMTRYAAVHGSATQVDLPSWRLGGWQQLPKYRVDLEGAPEEPISLQWAGRQDEIASALDSAGWRRPVSWSAATALAWLVPDPNISRLSVLPKFHQGSSEAFSFVRHVNPQQRLVLRFWRSEFETGPEGGQRRVWLGTVSMENTRRVAGFITLIQTAPDASTPVRGLEQTLSEKVLTVQTKQVSDPPVLLIW